MPNLTERVKAINDLVLECDTKIRNKLVGKGRKKEAPQALEDFLRESWNQAEKYYQQEYQDIGRYKLIEQQRYDEYLDLAEKGIKTAYQIILERYELI
ncbi:MAG: hypothetical protein D6706_05640 [Chloroflexi bacterium]|nr:MAG: hypothetical protein D6706_05640 [Chloroflexota bacterium]